MYPSCQTVYCLGSQLLVEVDTYLQLCLAWDMPWLFRDRRLVPFLICGAQDISRHFSTAEIVVYDFVSHSQKLPRSLCSITCSLVGW